MIGRGLEVLDEPSLEFRYGQMLTDPRDGLSLFGPYDGDASGHPASVSYGLVGTPDGIELFLKWSEAMVLPRVEAPRDRHRLWPPYPGFEVAFGSTWQTQPVWKHTIDREALLDVARRHDPYERCYSVVDHYLEAFSVLEKLDQHVPLMVCVVPEQVYQTCRPQSRVTQPRGKGFLGEDASNAGEVSLKCSLASSPNNMNFRLISVDNLRPGLWPTIHRFKLSESPRLD